MFSPKPITVPDSPDDLPTPSLGGVHHTARPTWRLGDTLTFYRDVMGLKLVHAISARGWGPGDHPDFIHLFFDSGQQSTIAFFYYLKNDRPADTLAFDSWLYRASHTAWRVDTRAQLLDWKARFEGHGLDVQQVKHEMIESIYVTDPNGYLVEITWQMRPMDERDAGDAEMTLNVAVALEAERGSRIETIDELWRAKAAHITRSLGEA